jgi:hypothetical protein
MKVEGFLYGIRKNGKMVAPQNMMQMEEEKIGEGCLQFFNVDLAKQVTGTTTSVFRICIEGKRIFPRSTKQSSLFRFNL